MTAQPNLRALPPPAEEPAPSYAYEAEQRRRIAAKDWAKLHVAGDRRAPLPWFEMRRRGWR